MCDATTIKLSRNCLKPFFGEWHRADQKNTDYALLQPERSLDEMPAKSQNQINTPRRNCIRYNDLRSAWFHLKDRHDLEESSAISKRKWKAEEVPKANWGLSLIGFVGLRRQWRHSRGTASEQLTPLQESRSMNDREMDSRRKAAKVGQGWAFLEAEIHIWTEFAVSLTTLRASEVRLLSILSCSFVSNWKDKDQKSRSMLRYSSGGFFIESGAHLDWYESGFWRPQQLSENFRRETSAFLLSSIDIGLACRPVFNRRWRSIRLSKRLPSFFAFSKRYSIQVLQFHQEVRCFSFSKNNQMTIRCSPAELLPEFIRLTFWGESVMISKPLH
jgi:hypothetical protein